MAGIVDGRGMRKFRYEFIMTQCQQLAEVKVTNKKTSTKNVVRIIGVFGKFLTTVPTAYWVMYEGDTSELTTVWADFTARIKFYRTELMTGISKKENIRVTFDVFENCPVWLLLLQRKYAN